MECDVWGDSLKRSRIKEELGAFWFGRRVDLALRNLPTCANVEVEAAIKASPGWILVSGICPLNPVVPEFSLLGEVSCGFYHFFVSEPIFAFRINCNLQ